MGITFTLLDFYLPSLYLAVIKYLNRGNNVIKMLLPDIYINYVLLFNVCETDLCDLELTTN